MVYGRACGMSRCVGLVCSSGVDVELKSVFLWLGVLVTGLTCAEVFVWVAMRTLGSARVCGVTEGGASFVYVCPSCPNVDVVFACVWNALEGMCSVWERI